MSVYMVREPGPCSKPEHPVKRDPFPVGFLRPTIPSVKQSRPKRREHPLPPKRCSAASTNCCVESQRLSNQLCISLFCQRSLYNSYRLEYISTMHIPDRNSLLYIVGHSIPRFARNVCSSSGQPHVWGFTFPTRLLTSDLHFPHSSFGHLWSKGSCGS